MRRKGILKNIANGLLGTFVSRNNDISGYWGIGVLRLVAETNDLDTLTLELLELEEIECSVANTPLSIAESYYSKWFQKSLSKFGVQANEIETAKIKIEFSSFEKFPQAERDTRGTPYQCTVYVKPRNGPVQSATKVGVCQAHDPNKESRSTRV